MRIGMGQGAAARRDVAYPHICQPPHRARDHWRRALHFGRMLDCCKRRHCTDLKLAVHGGRYLAEPVAQSSQAHQPGRAEPSGLHHQHQRGAPGNWPYIGIVWVDQRYRFLERCRLNEVKRCQCAVPRPPMAKAATSLSVKCFSMSFAFAFSTGWPMLPNFPVMVASTEKWIVVFPPVSDKRAIVMAVNRPTIPKGVPSTLASISSGGESCVSSTSALTLKRKEATWVSRMALK